MHEKFNLNLATGTYQQGFVRIWLSRALNGGSRVRFLSVAACQHILGSHIELRIAIVYWWGILERMHCTASDEQDGRLQKRYKSL